MNEEFQDLFELDGRRLQRVDAKFLDFGESRVPIRSDIPQFTQDQSYSQGNFSLLREKHAKLQLDSENGTTDRRDTILARTNWPPEFWNGKLVLECGTGAGADTEWLLRWGAKVVSVDLVGSENAQKNLGRQENLCLIQASITELPFWCESFDVVFCHRVLQHTPHPEQTLAHILTFVKQNGHAFVHSYARTFFQMFRWKYALRPITTRLDPEKLYELIARYAPFSYSITSVLNQTLLGKYFSHVFIPFYNYRHQARFEGCPREWIVEYGIHDTFDALSPPYDRPISANKMESIGSTTLTRDFEIEGNRGITLLRTKIVDDE